jgi:threonine dehydratase
VISLDDIRAAARRIAGAVRETPIVTAAPALDGNILLKLESVQVTGSFKARGAISKLRTLAPETIARGIVTASGGNHGIAVAYAGRLAGVPATIYVPEGVSPAKAEKIRRYGADLRVHGRFWDESNQAALARAAEGLTYFHPFADDAVMAGQGTVAVEMLEQAPEIDTILVAIGGGGLISGMAVAAQALKPGVKIVGVEPVGAATLHDSLAAGRVVELQAITTKVPTLAARKTEQVNFDIVRRHVERVVLIEDEHMYDACRWLWRELGVAADPSGAAAVAALLQGRYAPRAGETVCALVCGAGAEGAQ